MHYCNFFGSFRDWHADYALVKCVCGRRKVSLAVLSMPFMPKGWA
jgi:hypothetical protein